MIRSELQLLLVPHLQPYETILLLDYRTQIGVFGIA
jgi:hypothetical protein